MNTKNSEQRLALNLSKNIRYLRDRRSLTQSGLAQLAGIPRSTLASLENGEGNPTLSVLAKLALGLNVPIGELISSPRGECRVFAKGNLPIKGEGRRVTVSKLLPDPIPGMKIDRVLLKSGAQLKGTPHRPGTREYLYCEKGAITLWVEGERYELQRGDVAAFSGDLAHSYSNSAANEAIGFSVVTLSAIRIE